MKVIHPSFVILSNISTNAVDELRQIEMAARTCYKSEDLITKDIFSAEQLIRNCIHKGHESVLEHSKLTVKIICDRGVSHELVRHRHTAYSQESTRYCNYGAGKFGAQITYIKPYFFEEGSEAYNTWKYACDVSEGAYFNLLAHGARPQEARSVLNNSLKTEVVVSADYREWRKIFELRCSKAAHPQMREIMVPLLQEVQRRIPIIFDDICY